MWATPSLLTTVRVPPRPRVTCLVVYPSRAPRTSITIVAPRGVGRRAGGGSGLPEVGRQSRGLAHGQHRDGDDRHPSPRHDTHARIVGEAADPHQPNIGWSGPVPAQARGGWSACQVSADRCRHPRRRLDRQRLLPVAVPLPPARQRRGRPPVGRPSSRIVAGTSSARTTVASSSTATSMPTPIILMKTMPEVANPPITTASSSAALVMIRAGALHADRHGGGVALGRAHRRALRSHSSRTRVSRNTS